MFPYKSNAFHAYQTNRNPLKLRFFVYQIATASIFGVLVFTEARAAVVDDAKCKFLSDRMIEMKDAVERYETLIMEIEENSDIDQFATIYNAACKD